jgi:hypothetical protein
VFRLHLPVLHIHVVHSTHYYWDVPTYPTHVSTMRWSQKGASISIRKRRILISNFVHSYNKSLEPEVLTWGGHNNIWKNTWRAILQSDQAWGWHNVHQFWIEIKPTKKR